MKAEILNEIPSKNIWGKIPTGNLAVSTDSRVFNGKDIFVCLVGEKFDAFKFARSIVEKGCPALIFKNSESNNQEAEKLFQKFPETCFIATEDPTYFLQEMARLWSKEWQKKSENVLIAISGSNGKTTHKEMLRHIFSSIFPGQVVATEKNNNNHIGVPLTLLDLQLEHRIGVIELGSNHPGEIPLLCQIANPKAGITTNIGATHLEFFETEENVFKEEAFLFHAVEKATNGQGAFILNGDDYWLKQLKPTAKTLVYSEQPGRDAKIDFPNFDKVKIHYEKESIELRNSRLTGKHNFKNLVGCYLLARNLFPAKEKQIREACESFVPKLNRSEWMAVDGTEVFMDAYNANPSSMRTSIEGFADYCQQKNIKQKELFLVLGDMNELGTNGPEMHVEIGQLLKNLQLTNVAFIGRFREHYQKGFGLPSIQCRDALQFKKEYWPTLQKSFKVFFIKGSRTLYLEEIVGISKTH